MTDHGSTGMSRTKNEVVLPTFPIYAPGSREDHDDDWSADLYAEACELYDEVEAKVSRLNAKAYARYRLHGARQVAETIPDLERKLEEVS